MEPRWGVTYGGLPTRPGFVRDHRLPLCLGGPDTIANLQYQSVADGHEKDGRERRACEDYCSGRISLGEARAQFHRE